MPGYFIGFLDDLESYNGKSGFGCNVTISAKVGKKVKRLEFRTKDNDMALHLETLLDKGEEIVVELSTDQNNFGTSFREVLNVYDNVSAFLASLAEKYADVA